ncbi:HAMP domain-containing sensor histidine kinase [Uliginosibacterium sediminicola]|uniref:histidine kinase n=1 Tax=Uliginosibacterium sediminicola TaxID=2024550 RepID=A0ABU9YX92_9RHOO
MPEARSDHGPGWQRIAALAVLLCALGILMSSQTWLACLWFLALCACLAWASLLPAREKIPPHAEQERVTIPSLAAVRPPDAGMDALAFLSVAGHDLRQPLQAIALYAATLATHSLADNSRQLVNGLEVAAETLSLQFEEVMAIAKLESGRIPMDYKVVSLSAILASTVAMCLPSAHEKGLHLRHVGTRLRVWADEPQLARAVERLVMHAIRTSTEGGVLLGCRRRGDNVLLEVRDSSGGVAPDLLAGVLEPFSRYGQRLPDRALGLILAQRIVSGLGGSLSHRSRAGQGSIYTITLPIYYSSR